MNSFSITINIIGKCALKMPDHLKLIFFTDSKTSSSDSNVTKKSGSDKKYKTNTTRKFWDYSLCSNFSVILWMTAIFLLANGYVFPLIYLVSFGRV